MTTVTTTTPPAIAGKFNIALTQSKFQQLADKANNLIYNEDNLEEIKQFLADTRKVEKAIEETHKDGKAEALKIGRDWDTGKNTFLETVAAIKLKPQQEYTKLCNDILLRQQQEEAEIQRKQTIKNGIETNAVQFAKDISNCTTSIELTNVERKINLEKTRKEKYMEFLDDANKRYTELNSLLATQKTTVKELEENARQQEIAKQQQDNAKLLELKEQQEQQEAKIEEAKVVVQETAINQSMKEETPIARTIFPSVSARRTTWKFEVVNEKEVMKKAPELVVFSIDEEKVKANLKLLKDSNQLEGKTELTINGIRYSEQKTF
jgi:hypothetical protein